MIFREIIQTYLNFNSSKKKLDDDDKANTKTTNFREIPGIVAMICAN